MATGPGWTGCCASEGCASKANREDTMTSAALPSNPFPGMNPYLESAGFGLTRIPGIIIGLRDFLAPCYSRIMRSRRAKGGRAREPYAGNGLAQVRVPDAVCSRKRRQGRGGGWPAAEPQRALPPWPWRCRLRNWRGSGICACCGRTIWRWSPSLRFCRRPTNRAPTAGITWASGRSKIQHGASGGGLTCCGPGRRCRWLAMRRRAATDNRRQRTAPSASRFVRFRSAGGDTEFCRRWQRRCGRHRQFE